MNTIWQTIINAATYNYSIKHCVINYMLISVSVLPHLVARIQSKANQNKWLWVLIISTFVQVFIWFSFNAVGVSIIWCSTTGFNILYFKREPFQFSDTTKLLYNLSFASVLIGVVYYFITLPFLTTIAHLIAILMGTSFFYLFKNKASRRFVK